MATLILILIAVAAAAALYLWLTGWQGSVTKSIGTPTVPSDLKFSIGGSTTVYPLSQLAIKWFEQNNTNTNITDQQGGSVAGAEAYCAGEVDVGAASSSFTTAQLADDGCSTALQASTVQTVIGVDAIVGIISTKNTGFTTATTISATGQVPDDLVSFNASTSTAVYVAASTSVPYSNTGEWPGSGASTAAYAYPGYLTAAPTGYGLELTALGLTGHAFVPAPTIGKGTGIQWNDIPFPAGCNVNTYGGTTTGGCYWPVANQNPSTTYDRLDSSGTEQGFVQKYLLFPKDASSNSCGTANQLQLCGIVATHSEEGNPLLATSVAGDANGFGFNSYGIAESTPGLIVAGYSNDIGTVAGVSNEYLTYTSGNEGAVVFPSVATVLVDGYRAADTAAAYGPWRVLEYLTDGTPATGTVEANYLNFVLGPEVNLNLATATGYISLYAA